MTTLEQVKAEAAKRYPLHEGGDCACYCSGCKENRVRRETYMHTKTISAEQVDKAAKASYEERTDTLWEAASEEDRQIEREDMRVGFRAAGFYLEE
ncbi:hypothetical protein [Nesterenkonia rhizosphaerae]|uniref:Uncharacterized protein n=1 Tax=Nesterenkonia rhizosphaerae TaxID=1348272 RepID=A0ABP9G0T1_9MICC